MTEHYTGYQERGPYPGEEPDITPRQSGWLYLALGMAVLLTFVSVILVATWPLAIAAWALVSILWTVELVAKRAAVKLQHAHGVRAHSLDPAVLREQEYARAAAARHAPHVVGTELSEANATEPYLREARADDERRGERPDGRHPSSP